MIPKFSDEDEKLLKDLMEACIRVEKELEEEHERAEDLALDMRLKYCGKCKYHEIHQYVDPDSGECEEYDEYLCEKLDEPPCLIEKFFREVGLL